MNNPEELVSIIVPVYNAGIYIEETINSVRAQTYICWELILVDDHSKDDTLSVVKNYLASVNDERIRLIEKKTNEGAAAARNRGIDAAKGRYIAFLDADDLWMPDKLEKELAFMKKKQAAFVFTSYEFGDENARGTGKIVHVPEELTYRKALSRTVIFTTTVLFDSQKTGRGLTRCWQSTEGLHPPYPPINWRLLEEYGICTEEKKNFLCRTVVIICFSGQFGLRCEGSESMINAISQKSCGICGG